jgi:hypothetical protein
VSIATAIAFAGWLATAVGWYLSQRSQRAAASKVFSNQLRNSARMEIASAVRNRQNVLSRLAAAGGSLVVSYKHDPGAGAWPEEKWRDTFDHIQQICATDDPQWAFVLEQYSALFPETATCRQQLVERASVLAHDVTAFLVGLLGKETRGAALSQAESLVNRLIDEQGLLEDLLVHVHDATFSEIVGRTASSRPLSDPAGVRIVKDKDGQLAVVEGE